MKTIVYGLVDPETKTIRYIGQTTNIIKRIKQHKKDKTGSKKSEWIQSILAKGYHLDYVILDTNGQDRDWIFTFNKFWDLLNADNHDHYSVSLQTFVDGFLSKFIQKNQIHKHRYYALRLTDGQIEITEFDNHDQFLGAQLLFPDAECFEYGSRSQILINCDSKTHLAKITVAIGRYEYWKGIVA
jgi:hypothetical protein